MKCVNARARKNYLNPTQQSTKVAYRETNRELLRDKQSTYREDNIEKCRASEVRYNQRNREKRKAYSSEYYYNNKSKYLERQITKKDHINELNRVRRSFRRENDPVYVLTRRLRSRIRIALNGKSKSKSSMELLGCDLVTARAHLQNTAINNGYTSFDINNYNSSEYHIDHIKPCSSFDLTDPIQQAECFNYKNLQILTAYENLSKGDSYGK